MLTIHWTCLSFAQLDTPTLYAILKLRQEVFVVEQTCPYLDADGADDQAWHLCGHDEQGRLVAYARLFAPTSEHAYSRIGRVVTAPSVRRTGVGLALMQEALKWCQQQHPNLPVRLAAQCYLKRFYQGFGFAEISDEYLEDDIPHVDMERHSL